MPESPGSRALEIGEPTAMPRAGVMVSMGRRVRPDCRPDDEPLKGPDGELASPVADGRSVRGGLSLPREGAGGLGRPELNLTIP